MCDLYYRTLVFVSHVLYLPWISALYFPLELKLYLLVVVEIYLNHSISVLEFHGVYSKRSLVCTLSNLRCAVSGILRDH
jgi:hypothetical protein